MPYHVYAIAFDTEGRTEGDLDDFRRALDALEREFPGAHLLGSDVTQRWPTYVIRESKAATGRAQEETRDG